MYKNHRIQSLMAENNFIELAHQAFCTLHRFEALDYGGYLVLGG